MPAEVPKTEEGAPVKTEPKEDEDAAPSKKKARQSKADKEKREEKSELKRNKEEEAGEDGEPEEAEDGMAPEAEPTQARNEVGPDTTFRKDAVHVYGLDFLKTGHMEEIFGQFSHRYIEWINESSANVVFRDATSARKALESLSYPKADDDPWRRTPDILVHDDLPAVFLQMRLAAPSDKKVGKKAVPSMNPPSYTTESNSRNHMFTMASLYDRRERTEAREQTEGAEPGKRKGEALPTAEITKRAKRAERFAATLGDPPAAEPAAADASAPAAEGSDKDSATKDSATKAAEDVGADGDKEPAAAGSNAAELAEEEAARRQKRAERFGTADAGAADAKKASAASGTDAAAPSEGVAAPSDAAEPSGEATAQSGDGEAAAEPAVGKAAETSEG